LITFHKIKAKNFMSFEELELSIPQSGLFYVVGEVEGSVADSNGAGKSAIWEALCWALYGRTIRGVAADDVVRRDSLLEGDEDSPRCFVEVTFSVDETPFSVCRSRFPAGVSFKRGSHNITMPTMQATDAKIRDILGMTFQVFTNSVYFPQGLPYRFTQVGDSEKKAVLDDILQLEWLEESRQNVRVAVSDVQAEAAKLERDKVRLEERRSLLMKVIADEESQLRKLEVETQELAERVAEESKKAIDLQRLEEMRERRNKLEDEWRKASDTLQREDMKVRQTERELRSVGSDLEAKCKRVGGVCPTCGQKVTESGIAGVIRLLEEKKASLEELLKQSVEATSSLKREEQKLSSEVVEVRRIVGEFEAQLAEQGALKATEASLEANRRVLRELRNRMRERTKEKRKLVKELKEAQVELESIGERLTHLNFWVEGFGNRGIKSMLLDSVVPMLNESAVRYSNLLTDGKISVEFRSTSETKAGQIRDKLSVVVREQSASDSYVGCSGGEKRRADVVVLLALHDLISRRSHTQVNLLILDEVFEALDKAGVERLVTLLQEFAREKAVYVISHMSEMGDFFDNVIRVRKSGGVSRVV